MMNRKGFTLIEVIVIIVILGILAAVAVPKYLDLSKNTEKVIVENLVGSMRSALSLYFAQFLAKQKGTQKNFRDNVSIPNFMKVPNDSMGMTGSETLILEKRVTSRFVVDNPASIKDYDLGGGRHLRFVFKNGAILDIYYDREKPQLDAVYTGFN
jgi:prepilin-type N-terminal cleavage/methylation domain-containing protein